MSKQVNEDGSTSSGVSSSENETNIREELIKNISDLCLSIDEELRLEREFDAKLKGIQEFRKIQDVSIKTKSDELNDIDQEFCQLKDEHTLRISALKQEMRQLLLENQSVLATHQVICQQSVKDANHANILQIEDMEKEKTELEKVNSENELAQFELINNMKLKHSEALADMFRLYQIRAKELANHFHDRSRKIKTTFEQKSADKIMCIEEKMRSDVDNTMSLCLHEMEETTNFFKNVIDDSFDKRKRLKNELYLVNEEESKLEKILNETKRRYDSIFVPLQDVNRRIELLRKKMAEHKKIKARLQSKRNLLVSVQLKLEDLKWNHEVIFQDLHK